MNEHKDTHDHRAVASREERHDDLVNLNDTVNAAKKSVMNTVILVSMTGIGVLVMNHFKLNSMVDKLTEVNVEMRAIAVRQDVMDREGTMYSKVKGNTELERLNLHGARLASLEDSIKGISEMSYKLNRMSDDLAEIKKEMKIKP